MFNTPWYVVPTIPQITYVSRNTPGELYAVYGKVQGSKVSIDYASNSHLHPSVRRDLVTPGSIDPEKYKKMLSLTDSCNPYVALWVNPKYDKGGE